ncbi:MAG: Asp23/Gls24 family envelope stress response protein [Anaerolineae bacterium]|nr:Asp23/Gls24 family envelope stress response protein [Anaerolineae bacterium]
MEAQPRIGKITIAPEVLETTARLTTLAVPGVARMTSPAGMRRLLRQDGVEIAVSGNSVRVKLYVVTEPQANMLNVGRQIQAEVTRAIQDMVGMEVHSVDVHIEDVAYPSEGT